jgi:hypothetical protein
MCLSKKGGKSLSGEIWEIHVPFKKGWQKFEWKEIWEIHVPFKKGWQKF